MKTSKVTNTYFDKEVNLDHGTFYDHIVEFENGDSGKYLSKSKDQNKFVTGQEADYEISQTKFGNKIKPAQPNNLKGVGGYAKRPANNASFALSYAKDIAVAHIRSGNEMGSKDVTAVADYFYAWLKSKEND